MIGEALTALAILALAAGRHDDAHNDLIAIRRIARQEEGAGILGLVLSVSMTNTAQQATANLLLETPGSAKDLAARWKLVEQCVARELPFREVVEFERLAVLQIALICRTSRSATEEYLFQNVPYPRDERPNLKQYFDGEWLSRMIRWKGAFAVDVNEQLEFINEYFDQMVAVHEREPDFAQRREAFAQLEEQFLEIPQLRINHDGIAATLADFAASLRLRLKVSFPRMFGLPATNLDWAVSCQSQRDRMLMALVLAEMHFRKTGRDITRGGELPALQQDYGLSNPAIAPTDLFSSDPLIVKREDGDIVIYSVGPDGEDDDGRPFNLSAGDDDIAVRLPRSKR